MFTTSLTAALLAGVFASGSVVGPPEWAEGYGKAMAMAGEKKKPMAVFLAAGELTALTGGKGMGPDTLKALKTDFIAVRIDPTTADGKKVADALGLTQGVVISDRTGKQMALKHDGPVTPEQLTGYLTKYSSAESISITEFQSSGTVIYQQPLYQQPAYQPVQYQQPRPVLNAIQNVGGAVQNLGGVMFSPFVGGS